jgi:lipopolysaccharide/colanic/teichoic acid biosynthesis glycosyltransferase
MRKMRPFSPTRRRRLFLAGAYKCSKLQSPNSSAAFVERHLLRVEQYKSRHMFKVGITGWAQVNGWRGDTSIAKRVEYDLYYLRNWSLTFDLQIMTMTILRIFNSKNAY